MGEKEEERTEERELWKRIGLKKKTRMRNRVTGIERKKQRRREREKRKKTLRKRKREKQGEREKERQKERENERERADDLERMRIAY